MAATDSEAPEAPRATQQQTGAIVICGLGRLGLECAVQLKAFGAPVVGISRRGGLAAEEASRFDRLVTGDCARTETLKSAGAQNCRAILLLTDDPRSNVAAAFAARRLNPRVRIVIRSAQENLNGLLSQQLGDLIAFEPGLFSARAFAVAALADETRARFELKGARTSVVAHRVAPGDWCDGRTPPELHSLHLRVIGHESGGRVLVDLFAMDSAFAVIHPGDVVTFVVNGELPAPSRRPEQAAGKRKPARWTAARRLRARMSSATLATLISLAAVVALTLGAVLLYRRENPDLTWFDAINVAVVLGVGGFDNVFGALKAPFPISPMLYAYSLLMKIGSAVFLGIVFANFTEKVLGARFAIAARRPETPAQAHSIVVGLSPIGQSVALQLKRWGRAVAGVSETPPTEDFLRDMPIESGAIREALARANVASARSVVVAGDDPIANLEVMLLARSLNPRCALVFRVADSELAANVSALIPDSLGINDAEVAAQAIAGAAFGENILSAFRLRERSILVTQYRIETGDTLIGRQLADVTYGYGVVALLHERGAASATNPSDDIRLEHGDGLVVLATIDALGRIERGEWRPPALRVQVRSCVIAANAFEAGNAIARIAGCDLATARDALKNLPSRLRTPVYPAQGARLTRELKKLGVIAELEEAGRPSA
jgi:Trk K+ transport system NAD-binding subunit